MSQKSENEIAKLATSIKDRKIKQIGVEFPQLRKKELKEMDLRNHSDNQSEELRMMTRRYLAEMKNRVAAENQLRAFINTQLSKIYTLRKADELMALINAEKSTDSLELIKAYFDNFIYHTKEIVNEGIFDSFVTYLKTIDTSESQMPKALLKKLSNANKIDKEILKFITDDEIECKSLVYMVNLYIQLEKSVGVVISELTEGIPICEWMKAVPGIGPIHAACMYSMIDINKAPYAGNIWSYAGWDGKIKRRRKGEKITWNDEFRTRCYLIGTQFVKVKNSDKDIYGHLYQKKKDFYIEKNESGGFREKAEIELELELKKANPSKENIELYKTGKISNGQIQYMAIRYAVKMFLSHLHEVWWELETGEKPAMPFAIEKLGHYEYIPAPFKEVVGLK